MPQADQDALLTRLENYQAVGMTPKQAQLEAAKETLKRLESEVVQQSVRSPLGFYSAMAESIAAMPTKQAMAGAWISQIKGLVNKGVVKQDEVEWSGLEDWLKLQEGKIAKNDIVSYLNENGVQVQETVLGKPEQVFDIYRVERGGRIGAYMQSYGTMEEAEDWVADRDPDEGEFMIDEQEDSENKTATKYSSYTLPGGENYREVLLTLPVNDKSKAYKSPHWDQANVLAHLRVNDRADADGKKVLFVEEVQSDFGQETKKQGAAGTVEAALKANGMTRAEFDALPKEDQAFVINETRNMGLPPVAPFVDKTDKWLTLALKRIIKMAVDGGYDKVAFVNGKQSAERYDLSKQVDYIDYLRESQDEYRIALVGKNGEGINLPKETFTAAELENYVGKEVAQKIVNGEGESGGGRMTLRGPDLAVGGAGMKTFYDAIVPNATKALLKKIGGGQMESVRLNTGQPTASRWGIVQDADNNFRLQDKMTDVFALPEKYSTKELAQAAIDAKLSAPQPGFTITDAMREKVNNGLPMFSQRVQTDSKEFKEWFGNSKAVGADKKPMVFYHGTGNGGFNVFDRNSWKTAYGHFFTPNKAAADYYNYGNKSQTYEVYLKAENPLRLDLAVEDGTYHESDWINDFIGDHFNDDGDAFFEWVSSGALYNRDMGETQDALMQAAEEAGHDAVVFYDAMGGGGATPSWVVFESTQIKSATDNNGDFDSANPDIRKSARVLSEAAEMAMPDKELNRLRAITGSGLIPREPQAVAKTLAVTEDDIKAAKGLAFSQRANNDSENQDIQNSLRLEASYFDDLRYKWQDKHIDTKRVVDKITATIGKLDDALDVYLQEELFHNRAAKRVADFGKEEIKPLMEQIGRDGYTGLDVEEYLQARHAPEANRLIAQRNPNEPNLQDGGSGMKNAEAQAYMASLSAEDAQKLSGIADKVDAIIKQTRNLYVSYGLENQDTVDAWEQMFKYYIPLQREDKEGGGMGIGQGFSVKGNETKGRTGSTRKVVNVLANIAMQREKLIVRGEKNRVATALVGLAVANPDPDLWQVGPPPSTRVYDPKTNTVVDRVDPMYKSRDEVLVAKMDVNGKIKDVSVVFNREDPRALRMVKALKNLDAANLEGLLGVSAKITRYFSAINTQYNPVFGVVNLVRDVQGAMLNLGETPLAGHRLEIAKNTLPALAGIYSGMRSENKDKASEWAKLFEEFELEGGPTGFRELFKTSSDRSEALQKLITPDAWMGSKLGKIFTANGKLKVPMSEARKGAGWIFDWLSDYNSAMENAVRLAAYKSAKDNGMSKQRAASLAKNLTVNFNRKGQAGQQAGAMYAFFNAAMQGTARIGQALFTMQPGKPKTIRLSSTGKRVVYGGILLGATQAMLLAAAGFGDDDPPEFLRERALIIPTGWTGVGPDKGYVSIPMPLGYHVIPGIGRHFAEFAMSGFEKPQHRAISVISMFMEAFNPFGNAGLSMQTVLPTAFDPFAALIENKDWTGKPIARTSSNKAVPGHTQFKDTATAPAKLIAEAINFVTGGNEYVAGVMSPTPDQIDYLFGQVFGGVGRELAKTEQAVKSVLSGEDLPTFKIPLVGRFIGNANSQASQASAFYNNVNKLNELETEVKGMQKDGKMQEAAALLRSRPDAYLIARANVAERQVQRLRREKRELLKKSAQRSAIKAKEAQITEAMKRLNAAMAQ